MARMARFSIATFFFFSLLLPRLVLADVTVAQAERYMETSGLGELLVSIQAAVQSRLNLQRLLASKIVVGDDVLNTVDVVAKRIPDPQLAIKYLTEEVDSGMMTSTLTFLHTPLGEKIRSSESESNRPEAQIEMQRYALALSSSPLPMERLALVKRLILEARMEDLVLRMLERVFMTSGDVAEVLTSTEQAQAFRAEITDEWRRSLPVIKVQFEQLILVNTQYIYRALSNDELERYVRFLSEPEGQMYWKTSMAIVDIYLKQFVAELVSSLKSLSGAA